MKGTLHKNKVEGWLVLYTVEETWDRCIPIHPDYEKYYFLDDDTDGKEVEFEIVQVAVDNNGTVVNYSRLIKPSVDKLGNEDVPKLGYDVEKLARQSWEGCDGCTEQDEVMYNNGYVKGYNAAISELPKEISDEEIEKASNTLGDDYYASELIMWEKGAKWYREQLKQRK